MKDMMRNGIVNVNVIAAANVMQLGVLLATQLPGIRTLMPRFSVPVLVVISFVYVFYFSLALDLVFILRPRNSLVLTTQ